MIQEFIGPVIIAVVVSAVLSIWGTPILYRFLDRIEERWRRP